MSSATTGQTRPGTMVIEGMKSNGPESESRRARDGKRGFLYHHLKWSNMKDLHIYDWGYVALLRGPLPNNQEWHDVTHANIVPE